MSKYDLRNRIERQSHKNQEDEKETENEMRKHLCFEAISETTMLTFQTIF